MLGMNIDEWYFSNCTNRLFAPKVSQSVMIMQFKIQMFDVSCCYRENSSLLIAKNKERIICRSDNPRLAP